MQDLNYLKNVPTSGDVNRISAVSQSMKIKYDLAGQHCANVDFAERLANDTFSQSLLRDNVPHC